jgi:hypothetical protein
MSYNIKKKKFAWKTFLEIILIVGFILFFVRMYNLGKGNISKGESCPATLQMDTYTTREGFYWGIDEGLYRAKDGTKLYLDCHKGQIEGENVNIGYCSGTYSQGDNEGKVIDLNGNIKKEEVWRFQFTVDLEDSPNYKIKSMKCDRIR